MARKTVTPSTGARHFGMTAPYALAGSTAAPQVQDDFEHEVTQAIRRTTMIRQAQALGALPSDGGSMPAPAPQPQSVNDVLQVGKYAVDVSKTVADTMEQKAKAAQEELDRVKQQAGDAYEAGKQEATNLFSLLDERERRYQERMDALTTQLREAEDKRRDLESARALEQIGGQIADIKKAHEDEKAELKRQLAQAEARAAAASQPKSGPELALDLIKQGEDPNSPRVQVLLHGRVPNPGQVNLEDRWQRVQLESHIDDLQDETSHKRAVRLRELDRVDKRDEMVDRLVDNVGKVLDLARKAGEQYLGVSGDGSAPASKAGLPHNNIAGTLEGIAQQVQQAGQGGAQA